MKLNKVFQIWSATMAKAKKAIEHLRKNKDIKVELIPAYIPHEEFLEKKAEVQKILAKMFISAHQRGRPSKRDEEELDYVA
jgi:hypothetical protein